MAIDTLLRFLILKIWTNFKILNGGAEVDFELIDGKAKSLFIIKSNSKDIQTITNQSAQINQTQNFEIENKCIEINSGIKGKIKIFYGIAYKETEQTHSGTFGNIKTTMLSGIKGAVGSMAMHNRTFKMGNETFLYIDMKSALPGLLGVGGHTVTALSILSGTLKDNIESGDELTVLCNEKKFNGYYLVGAIRNHTKDYVSEKNIPNSKFLKTPFILLCIIGIISSLASGYAIFSFIFVAIMYFIAKADIGVGKFVDFMKTYNPQDYINS